MKILWLSVNSGLYQNTSNEKNGYHGGGWVSSLQRLLIESKEHKLAFAYITHVSLKKEQQENTIYYPIYEALSTKYKKIKEYYGGYRKIDYKKYVDQIEQIIKDFKPDIIHLFGLENSMANILGNTTVPIVVHLQGLLSPYDNAFFPVDFNKLSFLVPFSVREWIFRNGYIFAKNSIHVRSKKELSLFKNVKYVMGRTTWDYQVSQFLAPQSKYFHVDEVLRDVFYENAGKWKYPKVKEFKIISTLSNTVYKGLDTILKTANLLKTQSNIPFKWNIVGINPQDEIVRFFERKLRISGKNLNIEYVGVLNAYELCNELLNNHIYVHPSYIDNSPNSVCEAQLLGMPVIGIYVGGIPSLINDNEDGLLVPANAPYELAYLLKNLYLEQDLATKLGNGAYNTASKRHDKEKILYDLINAYKKVIEKTQRYD